MWTIPRKHDPRNLHAIGPVARSANDVARISHVMPANSGRRTDVNIALGNVYGVDTKVLPELPRLAAGRSQWDADDRKQGNQPRANPKMCSFLPTSLNCFPGRNGGTRRECLQDQGDPDGQCVWWTASASSYCEERDTMTFIDKL
jgi:hypothetical protein